MKINTRFLICFGITILLLSSCGVLWEPWFQNNIDNEFVLELNEGDIYVYSSVENTKNDSFLITNYKNIYLEEEDMEEISVEMQCKHDHYRLKTFNIQVTPAFIAFYYDEGDFSIPMEVQHNFELGELKYRRILIYESDTYSEADSIINKLYYHGNKGIIGYRYENGDEYLLDTIIKAE